MSLNRSEKQVVIEEVSALAAKAQTLVMAEYRGITVAALTQLRVAARSQGVSLSVLKNTLARRAVAGTGFEAAVDQMTGPLIYGFSEDAVAAAKAPDPDRLAQPAASARPRAARPDLHVPRQGHPGAAGRRRRAPRKTPSLPPRWWPTSRKPTTRW